MSRDSLQEDNGSLTVHCDLAGVQVVLDTILLGVAPLNGTAISEGVHVLRFIHPESKQWQYSALIETVTVHPTEHFERTVHFPYFYHITSEPYGATVRFHDSIIGVTPLYFTGYVQQNFVSLSKDGFEETTIPLSGDPREVHVILKPLRGFSRDKSSDYLSFDQSKNPVPIYITTGATVLSGVAAAYFKIKADGYYDEYRRTYDPGTLDQVHRYDVVSGISLAASEISLLVLTYLLLSH
ncbi:MAG: PEGA domain-containing protein [Ignavibacteria bacterium]|nr:PEGA domain-containing protein [Ignavibacteria bacterium]MBI3765257.1 PEGA domain-containing protein [Ignavibacteriales bacterium]